MAEKQEVEEDTCHDCVRAFKSGKKCEVQLLLPRLSKAVVRTTRFELRLIGVVTSVVSMLHVAAFKSWLDIVTDLIVACECEANLRDDRGRTPLHYAAFNGHLEVVR